MIDVFAESAQVIPDHELVLEDARFSGHLRAAGMVLNLRVGSIE